MEEMLRGKMGDVRIKQKRKKEEEEERMMRMCKMRRKKMQITKISYRFL